MIFFAPYTIIQSLGSFPSYALSDDTSILSTFTSRVMWK